MSSEALAVVPAVVDIENPVSALIDTKRSAHTRRAYAADLADFFGGAPTPAEVLAFLHQPTPAIAAALHRWIAQLPRAPALGKRRSTAGCHRCGPCSRPRTG
ncbi:MAG: hypothetical protein KGJ86_03200 [Chloroflexota bacterium]|nr:hypothetical protein [Chloroflexota bacterium]